MAVDSNAPIAFTFAGLPGGDAYCFTTPQRLALDITNNLSGYIPGQYSVIIDSESEPAVADRGKLWHKLNTGGSPTGLLFKYFGGQWVSPNREEANSDVRRIFRGSASDVWSYDGGDGTDPSTNPPSDAAGAMWEIDTDLSGRMPLGAGTLQPSGTVVAVDDTGGADEVVLTEAQLAEHTHALSPGGDGRVLAFTQPSGNRDTDSGSDATFNPLTETEETGDDEPHTNMPPYLAVYFIRRTSRIYYVA